MFFCSKLANDGRHVGTHLIFLILAGPVLLGVEFSLHLSVSMARLDVARRCITLHFANVRRQFLTAERKTSKTSKAGLAG
jgi:hypothetical protein